MILVEGGKYRGRKLLTPDSSTTLPTKNMVRGAMFSALFEVRDERVLDLYAGSGALGIEALSRGAKSCLFVEKDLAASRVIESNLKSLKEGNGEVWHMDDLSALSRMKQEGRCFDLVLLDPPYAYKSRYQEAVDYLISEGLVSEKARFILEYEGDIPFDTKPYPFSREYKYGKSKFLYLRRG